MHFPHDGYIHRIRALFHRPPGPPDAQCQAFLELGVAEDRIYTDHGLTGTTRVRPCLAARRQGDTLVVPKLDRLARSVPNARAIADQLIDRQMLVVLFVRFPAEGTSAKLACPSTFATTGGWWKLVREDSRS